MTRIVVIGNSHAAALKAGWDAIAAGHPGVGVEFLAAPPPHEKHMRLGPGLTYGLQPDGERTARAAQVVTRINGRTSIDLAGATVLWAGYPWGFRALQEMLLDTDVDGLRDTGAAKLMSRAAFDAVLAAFADAAVPPPQWRDWRDARLVITPRPLTAEGCRTDGNPDYAVPRDLALRPEGMMATLAAYTALVARALASHGIALLPQPAGTITADGLTRDDFARGSRSVFRQHQHDDADQDHMNARYGAECLKALLATEAVAAAGSRRAAEITT